MTGPPSKSVSRVIGSVGERVAHRVARDAEQAAVGLVRSRMTKTAAVTETAHERDDDEDHRGRGR